jgi:hypothetical protein
MSGPTTQRHVPSRATAPECSALWHDIKTPPPPPATSSYTADTTAVTIALAHSPSILLFMKGTNKAWTASIVTAPAHKLISSVPHHGIRSRCSTATGCHCLASQQAYLCAFCGCENKQRLFHCTALTGWFL